MVNRCSQTSNKEDSMRECMLRSPEHNRLSKNISTDNDYEPLAELKASFYQNDLEWNNEAHSPCIIVCWIIKSL